jgi:membrane associated rhomboid family serine protease
MFPLRDDVVSSRFPVATLGLIVVNVIVYLLQLHAGPAQEALVMTWGLVPARVLHAPPGGTPRELLTMVTSMFLHGDPLHLLGNMWFLWIFGDNIEDRLGHLRFVLFYFACGLVAAASQVLLSPESFLPMVGASGAIAGVLGAYLRLYPGARVLTLVPIFIFIQFIELPAILFLGLWFATQIFSSLMGVGGVAWWAHVFVFLAGLLLSFLFGEAVVRRRRPRARGQVLRYRR